MRAANLKVDDTLTTRWRHVGADLPRLRRQIRPVAQFPQPPAESDSHGQSQRFTIDIPVLGEVPLECCGVH